MTARILGAVPSSWDLAYEGTPTWDTGRPQPAVVRLVEHGSLVGSVLDVGCGTGVHAVLLAARGHRVAGLDVSARAIAAARARSRDAGVRATWSVRDARTLAELPAAELAVLGGPWDTVLDVGLFHSLQPDDRSGYSRSLAAVVAPGGRLFVLAWSSRNPFGYGPERITHRALRRSFRGATGWRVESIDAEELETLLPEGTVHAWVARAIRVAGPASGSTSPVAGSASGSTSRRPPSRQTACTDRREPKKE